MATRLTAKIGSYTNNEGQEKGRYANIGVEIENANGAFILLDPTVNLAGVLALQNQMAMATGQQQRDRVMVSKFADEPRQQANITPQAPAQAGIPAAGLEDDIPF